MWDWKGLVFWWGLSNRRWQPERRVHCWIQCKICPNKMRCGGFRKYLPHCSRYFIGVVYLKSASWYTFLCLLVWSIDIIRHRFVPKTQESFFLLFNLWKWKKKISVIQKTLILEKVTTNGLVNRMLVSECDCFWPEKQTQICSYNNKFLLYQDLVSQVTKGVRGLLC